jgi:3,4-dihydroxy 2-butanone 4-phosphate synthase/GTP cyclohydrolase II
MGFMVRYSSGVVCVPMKGELLDELNIPPMTAVNEDQKGTAYTVSVDAKVGVDTGISAADRSLTVNLLADAKATANDFTRPGHIFPLRAVKGGVLRRAGHTEAAVDLIELAGLPPVGVICELVHDDGSMMRAPACRDFADEHDLKMISIAGSVCSNF